MTPLRQRMLEELQRRNYSKNTVTSYISAVKEFAEYFKKSPALLGSEEVRRYELYLFNDKKLCAQTVKGRMSALRFFYWKVLKRRDLFFDDLPIPKIPVKLPVVLSREEVSELIDSASSLKRRTMLMVLYATGIRRAELAALKIIDIDSKLMVLHIRSGKGQRDRDLPMTPRLLHALRDYYRWTKPRLYLFPGRNSTETAEEPITSKSVWHACHDAAASAGLTKAIGPHTLRHSFATHHVEAGTDLRTIQLLMGHTNIKNTMIYLHLSQRHMRQAPNPLDQLAKLGFYNQQSLPENDPA